MAAKDVLETKPTQPNLDSISSKAGDNWRSLLTQLGVEEATIEGFLQKKLGKTSEACFSGLVYWLKGNSDKPVTWETLLKAMREANLTGYAEDLEKGLEEPSQDDGSERLPTVHTASEMNQLDTKDQNIEGQESNLATTPDITTFNERSIKIKRIVQKYKEGGEVRLPCNPDLEKKYDDILWSVKGSLSSATPKMIEKAHYFVYKMYERLYNGMTPTPPEVAKTSDALCKFIDSLSSPYEVFLVERAVDGVSDEELKKALCDYKLELCKYLEEKLFSCQSRKVTLPQRTDHTHMVIVISEEQALLSLVLHLKEYFVAYIGLQQSLFEGFQEGCSVFYFAITTADAVLLAPKILSHLADLERRFNVTHVIVFGHFVLDVDKGSVELLPYVDEAALSRSRDDLERSEAALKEVQMKSKELEHQVIATTYKLTLKEQQLIEAEKEKLTFKKLKDELERQKAEEKKLQSRIGELTTLLEEKEQKIAAWKESEERMEIRYSEHEGQKSLVVDKQTQRDQEGFTSEENTEESIAHEVLDRRKETLKSKMEFWEIVPHARKFELVKDEFVDRLMREGLSANTNEELVTKFLKEITAQSGWFDRFICILGGISKYRHLAVQLNDEFTQLELEKKGTPPSSKLLKLLQNAIKTLRDCKTDLQKALECHGLMSVQHCVNVLGVVGDYLQTEVRHTKRQSESPLDGEERSDKDETAVHVLPGPGHTGPQDQAQMNKSGVNQQPKVKVDKSEDTSGQRADTTLGGFTEVRLAHEVLRRNRGYLEMTIPMDVIITTLEAQDVLLPYELHQVKSHASLIEKNRSFLGSLMRKSPDMFYSFCSIMEGLPGYEYIGRYLRAEMKDVDPSFPFDEMRQTIPKAVDALVDKELLEKSIQSIVDKQREMAEEVRKVHQTEVSQLKNAVSDARDKVSDVKEECNKIFKQMNEEKSGSSEQLVTLQERIAEIVKVCEDVQIQQKEDDRSTQENIISAMKLQSRIGELTTLLEEKEQEIAVWKGSAKRMEIRYTELEGQRLLMVNKLTQRDQKLAESKVRYDHQREKYEKMIENKRKEIEDLENKYSDLEGQRSLVVDKLAQKEQEYSDLEGQRSLVVDKLAQKEQELAEGKKNYEHQRIEYEEISEKNRDLQKNLDMFQLSVRELEKRPPIVQPESEGSERFKEAVELWLVEFSCFYPRQWDKDTAERWLQDEATNDKFVINRSGPSKDDLTLSVWNDGKCSHLEVFRYKDDTSKPPRVSYSLVKHSAVYFESLYDLCKQYESKPLPGCGFGLNLSVF